MPWLFSGDRAIYSQLVEILQLKIVNGEFPPGSRVPSVRELADEAAVNPNTMQRALAELERLELVCSQRTAGRFVTGSQERIDALKHEIAGEKIARFIDEMGRLGFEPGEIPSLISAEMQKESEEVSENE